MSVCYREWRVEESAYTRPLHLQRPVSDFHAVQALDGRVGDALVEVLAERESLREVSPKTQKKKKKEKNKASPLRRRS